MGVIIEAGAPPGSLSHQFSSSPSPVPSSPWLHRLAGVRAAGSTHLAIPTRRVKGVVIIAIRCMIAVEKHIGVLRWMHGQQLQSSVWVQLALHFRAVDLPESSR